MNKISWSLLFLFIVATQVEAASFDCTKSATKIEKLICENDELSKLDETLSESYKKSLQRPDIKEKAIESQRQWLKKVRNPCDTVDCVKSAYETRIKEIELMSSFGIVIMSAPAGNGLLSDRRREQSDTSTPKVSVIPPRKEVSKPQVALPTISCDQSLSPEKFVLTNEKTILKLIEVAKAELLLKQYECTILALEQANRRVKSIDDEVERAALGFEIKDMVFGMIQQKNILSPSMEMRAIAAAVQSVETNGSLSKSSGEDERFNDAAFYGQMADAKCGENGNHLAGTVCEHRELILKMMRLDFSLPPKRHYVETWRYPQYLDQLDLLDVASLWKEAPEEIQSKIEAALPARLGQTIQSYVWVGIDLMPPEKARTEAAGLNILGPAIERVKSKQSDFWIWWVYRYAAEAYWQAGDKGKARDMLSRARDSIKTARSAPAVRVDAYVTFATSLCKSVRVNGKLSEMCPIGIYDARDLSSLFDEVDGMAREASDSQALARVEVLRKKLYQATSK